MVVELVAVLGRKEGRSGISLRTYDADNSPLLAFEVRDMVDWGD
jgi:hypothetical protein